MTGETRPEESVFDHYEYDSALAQGLSVSGEDKEYFARGRISWLARCLEQLGSKPTSIMDYGCGTGSAAPIFVEHLRAATVIGVDASSRLLNIASSRYTSSKIVFRSFRDYKPRQEMDLVFCNGVFHHIVPDERADALQYISRSLKSGGVLAFWENNPWNPGTRYVMSRIPFDRDAIPLTHLAARRLLMEGGLEVLRTDFMFIFPKALRWFRGVESVLSSLPLGAQYQVLCRKV